MRQYLPFFQIISVFFLLTVPAQAVTFEFLNAKGERIFGGEQSADLGKNVGIFTTAQLDLAQAAGQLLFKGDEDGVVSINGEGNDIQVVSPTEVKAYGWCFSVNGVVVDTLSNETLFKTDQDSLVWYYAYASNQNGNWVSMCVPAWK